MEYFGITHYGPQNFIHDICREDYREPKQKDDVEPLMEKVLQKSVCPKEVQGGRPDHKVIRQIDCYIGRVNGFAYGSFERIYRMKQKGVLKPVGPVDMYRMPPTTYSENGWFLCDPEIIKTSWYKTHPRYPATMSPNTKTLDIVKKNNKYATLF